jgi:hypothetical protein
VNARSMVRGLALDVGLPLVAYYGLHLLGVADGPALLAATLAAGVRIVWVAVRERRLNPFATLLLVVFGLGLALSFASGDPRFLLLKGAITTAVVGLVFLVTSVWGTPITLAAAQGFAPGSAEQARREYDEEPAARHAYRFSARVWGAGLLVSALVRAPLVFTLPISVMVGLDDVITIGVIALLVAWNAWYVRRARARADGGSARVAAGWGVSDGSVAGPRRPGRRLGRGPSDTP